MDVHWKPKKICRSLKRSLFPVFFWKQVRSSGKIQLRDRDMFPLIARKICRHKLCMRGSLDIYLTFLEDAPWCEIRPTHAGYKMMAKNQLEGNLLDHPRKDKDRYVPGSCVKGRNEPCFIVYVRRLINAMHARFVYICAKNTDNTLHMCA